MQHAVEGRVSASLKRHICLFAFCLRALKPAAKAWPRYTLASLSTQTFCFTPTATQITAESSLALDLGIPPKTKSITETKQEIFREECKRDQPKIEENIPRWTNLDTVKLRKVVIRIHMFYKLSLQKNNKNLQYSDVLGWDWKNGATVDASWRYIKHKSSLKETGKCQDSSLGFAKCQRHFCCIFGSVFYFHAFFKM